jgi:thiosulfate/3-mercaptopyruvate sulfurtransferase
MFDTILSVRDLQSLLDEAADVLVIDCEFDLGDPDRGRATYRQSHLPGALYLDLQQDLSGPETGTNGRHPLPARTAFAATMRRLGLKRGQQVVLYDGASGIYAARAWWMIRWLGHAEVAVLDGGRQAWVEAGLPLEDEEPAVPREGNFTVGEPLVGDPVSADQLMDNLTGGTLQVIDARDAQRFGGGAHSLDTVSGHIPGASNRFYRDNLDEAGRFRSPGELAQAFASASSGKPPERTVMQCGSGVTACHNALAMEIAGLKGTRLYPGSWSEWTSDPTRPVA